MTPDIQHGAIECENIRVRAVLMAQLRQMMRDRGLTQVQAARWFHVSQSRVSHLVNDRKNRFTIDTLANMLASAGVHVSVTFQKVHGRPIVQPQESGRHDGAPPL